MDNTSQFSFSHFFENPGLAVSLFETTQYAWEALPRIDDFIKNFKNSNLSEGYKEINENVLVGDNVTIDDTARINGAAIIGHNSVIGHAAFLRGGVIIGDGVNVGHATEVKHSLIFSRTALAHLNYIGDSIIGSNCNISGGATLANWRFDRKEVTVKTDTERIGTGTEKFGALVGDGSFLGVSAVLNPGTVLGKDCLVFPLVSVVGTYPASSHIK